MEGAHAVLGQRFVTLRLQYLLQHWQICRKVPKFSDARKICCNLPKIQTKISNLRVFHPKHANGKANSEDPDQTAPQSGLHCLPRHVCPKTLDHYGTYGFKKKVYLPYEYVMLSISVQISGYPVITLRLNYLSQHQYVYVWVQDEGSSAV